MITKLLFQLNKKALFFSVAYTIALAVLSLITIDLESIEDVVPTFSDKLFHFLAYALLTYLWFNTFYFRFKMSKKKAIIYASSLSFLFGIVIEVLQKVITSTRDFDTLDILANTFGVFFTLLLMLFSIKSQVKKQ